MDRWKYECSPWLMLLEEEYKTQVDEMIKVELDNMRLLSGSKKKGW